MDRVLRRPFGAKARSIFRCLNADNDLHGIGLRRQQRNVTRLSGSTWVIFSLKVSISVGSGAEARVVGG
jgi:hypothetical protein